MRKSNILKRIAALVFGAILTVFVSVSAFAADSKVTYQGGADAFVVIPENKDLFQNFKGVMPGDTLTQPIIVRNTVSKSGGVKIYLRAESTDETVKDFLKQMTLTVKQGEKVLSEASSDQTAGLTENVLLGTFSKDTETKLEAVLTVPITMENDFQNAKGIIHWIFTAEEITSGGSTGSGGGGGSSGGGGISGRVSKPASTDPVPEEPTPIPEIIEKILPFDLPKTGDDSKTGVLMVVNAVALILIIGLVVLIRKRKQSDEKL